MLGCLIKTVFITIPLAILIFGITFFIQGARFWIDIVGPPNTVTMDLEFDKDDVPFEVVVFMPDSVRAEHSPLDLEIEVNQIHDLQQLSQNVEIEVIDSCDYIRIEHGKTILTFDTTNEKNQSSIAELLVRNNRPSPSCPIEIRVVSSSAVATLEHSIPINGWTGQLLAIGKLLAGLLGGGLGLSGILAALFA